MVINLLHWMLILTLMVYLFKAIFKSSPVSLWPILVDFINLNLPLPVSIFYGQGKPDFKEFLAPFIEKVLDLKSTGLEFPEVEKVVKLAKVKFICDAPAQAAIMFVTGHTAKTGCACCRAESVHMNNRMVYPTKVGEPRTDEAYQNVLENNQNEKSPLLSIATLYSNL